MLIEASCRLCILSGRAHDCVMNMVIVIVIVIVIVVLIVVVIVIVIVIVVVVAVVVLIVMVMSCFRMHEECFVKAYGGLIKAF